MRRTALSCSLSLLTAAALTACGGGAGEGPTAQLNAAPAAVSLEVDLAGSAGADVVAQPTFHTAAVDLAEPDNGAEPHRAQAYAGV